MGKFKVKSFKAELHLGYEAAFLCLDNEVNDFIEKRENRKLVSAQTKFYPPVVPFEKLFQGCVMREIVYSEKDECKCK